jgi:hypothetical protein
MGSTKARPLSRCRLLIDSQFGGPRAMRPSSPGESIVDPFASTDTSVRSSVRAFEPYALSAQTSGASLPA